MEPQADQERVKPKLWSSTWAKEYKYSVPKPHGDHWDIMLDRFLTKDKFQCDAWKDEVQNLLIFAGLFSAVVTAFAVESYKTLQSDPNVALTVLLAHIAAGVDTLTNNSDHTISVENTQYPTVFSPTSTSIHINIFWFSSLILSLATVIIGIVSLQWLREHQRYTEPLSSKQALAVFHLRSAALDQWRIPHIFTTLPLLLQGAVILFFTGLGEFLLVLSPVVAAPAFVLMGLLLTFLIGTTILPALQLMLASFRLSSNSSIPSQCPYKSPQSWAFLHLLLLAMRIPHLLCRFLGHIPWPNLVLLCFEPIRSLFLKLSKKVLTFFESYLTPLPLNIQAAFNHRNWIHFDISWLTLRDVHFLSQKEAFIRIDDNIRPTYDLIQALVSSAKEQSVHEEVVLVAYHGLKELCDAIVADEMLDVDLNNSEADKVLVDIARVFVLQSGFLPFRSEYFMEDTNLRVTRDETLLAFLRLPGICDHSSNSAHPTGLHRMELFTRLLVYNRFREVGDGKEQVDPIHPLFAELKHAEREWEIPQTFLEDMVQQHYLILERLFQQARNDAIGASPSEIITVGRYSMLSKYLNYIASFRSPESLESNYLSVLSIIEGGLTFSLESQGYDKADSLFFCARLYLESVARHRWFSDLMKFGSYKIRRAILSLLETMLRYEGQLDKSTYYHMTRSWEVGPAWKLNDDANHLPASMRLTYEPIPEALLRFIPYEQRAISPQLHLLKIQVHDDVDATSNVHFDKVDSDGERIFFAVPPEDIWEQRYNINHAV